MVRGVKSKLIQTLERDGPTGRRKGKKSRNLPETKLKSNQIKSNLHKPKSWEASQLLTRDFISFVPRGKRREERLTQQIYHIKIWKLSVGRGQGLEATGEQDRTGQDRTGIFQSFDSRIGSSSRRFIHSNASQLTRDTNEFHVSSFSFCVLLVPFYRSPLLLANQSLRISQAGNTCEAVKMSTSPYYTTHIHTHIHIQTI